jgi:hypothetical protein
MGLLTTDIRKERRLSLKDVKPPAPDRKPINVEAPSTAEERMYSKIVEKCPLFLEAVELLDLVSPVTGMRVRIVDIKPPKEALITLANKLIKGEDTHSKEDIIEAIQKGSRISKERAERGFNLMLEAGAFQTIGDNYYLTGSTPF